MKATLEFQIPDERDEFKHSYSGFNYLLALSDFSDHLRKIIKYAEPQPKEASEIFQTRIQAYERIRQEFNNILNERDIDL